MPMQVDVIGLIITIIIVMIAVFLIPALISVKNASQQFEQFLQSAQRDVLPMLRELREASERLNRAAAQAEKGLGEVSTLFHSLQEVGESVHNVNAFLRHDVGRYLGNLAGMWLGFRSASKAFVKHLTKDKGGK